MELSIDTPFALSAVCTLAALCVGMLCSFRSNRHSPATAENQLLAKLHSASLEDLKGALADVARVIKESNLSYNRPDDAQRSPHTRSRLCSCTASDSSYTATSLDLRSLSPYRSPCSIDLRSISRDSRYTSSPPIDRMPHRSARHSAHAFDQSSESISKRTLFCSKMGLARVGSVFGYVLKLI